MAKLTRKSSTNERNALNSFRDLLGEYCAMNQFVELAKRCFNEEHAGAINSKEHFTRLAEEHSLTVTEYRDDLINIVARGYIVNIHLCFEAFLKRISKELRKYGENEFKEKDEKESWLRHIENNTVQIKTDKKMRGLFELCEYYRLVRNASAHESDQKECGSQYKKIAKYEFSTDAKFGKLQAPNAYDEISFDDFILFSQSCNELATYIFKHMSYDYEKIVENIPVSIKSKWKRYTTDRCGKALRIYISTEFNVSGDLDEKLPYLVDMVRAT